MTKMIVEFTHRGMGKKYTLVPSRFFISKLNEIEIARSITTYQPQVN